MGVEWGGTVPRRHDCYVGIVRLPGLGWPVKCTVCGRIGFGKDKAEARKLGQNHSKQKNG